MPELEYFLVCRSVQRDATTDEMSFINVLEDISPDTLPHVIPRAMAVSLWNLRQEELTLDYQATLVVKLPGSQPAAFSMNFSRLAHRCRAIQGILEIPVHGPGDIEFEVLLNGNHAASHRVRIHPPGVRDALEAGDRLPQQE